MTNLIPFSGTLTMTSREIAELTGKRHADVMRDIRAMIERFEEHNSTNADLRPLDWSCETESYVDAKGEIRQMYRLDKNTTLCLVAGYDPIPRMRIIQRLDALESGNAFPKTADPIIGALVHGLMEIDSIKQQNALLLQHQAEQDRKTEILENRVQNVELQHRNGVPEGYLSKKEAHHLYGVGLSEEIFECLLVKLGVTSKRYMHIADGYKTPSTAYLEIEIQPAVEMFLEDAVQCSPQMCQSPMLDGKRFRYAKEAFGKEEVA